MGLTPQILERLDRTFEGGVEGIVARKLFSFLMAHPEATHITLQLVRQVAWDKPDKSSDAAVVRTLQYLSGGGESVLETKFELFEDDQDDVPYVLSDEEIGYVLSDGINPISGEYDADIKRKVAIFFVPTDNMKNLLSEFNLSAKGEK